MITAVAMTATPRAGLDRRECSTSMRLPPHRADPLVRAPLDAGPPALTAQAAEPAHEERIDCECLGIVDERVQEPVVARRGHAESLGDGGTLRAGQLPPAALELEDRSVTIVQGHGDRLAAPPTRCKHPRRGGGTGPACWRQGPRSYRHVTRPSSSAGRAGAL